MRTAQHIDACEACKQQIQLAAHCGTVFVLGSLAFLLVLHAALTWCAKFMPVVRTSGGWAH
jgi:hypothetical protein